MSFSRFMLVFAGLGTLVGCVADLEDEFDLEDEEIGMAEQAAVNATGTIFNTGGDSVNVRSGPNTSSSIVGVVHAGASVGIECQTTGTVIEGTSIWNFLPAKGGYVTDAYVYTGYSSFIPGVPRCGQTGGGGGGSGGGGSTGDLGAAIVAKARSYKGYEAAAPNCSTFSAQLGTGCVEWCADFVRYVWGQSGAKTTNLSAAVTSFRTYGTNNGTWKAKGTNVVPKVGDAVLWGNNAHVAIISEVSGNQFKIVHGNYDNNFNGRGEVFETGFVDHNNTAGTGYSIIGYVSPVK
ncbi:CHAP domain-containing protein [Chondromyces crocatus]|uniref:SH3b domain-containing protein n=1 Tax=Chondromyces crocatus TaxID=52 RepID=A0A0K1EIF2_CHOCO|nr:CHAP domain-containing protein [Chondromyces crocatus]AKT40629.1 uncharacterized protein CMC5_047850 [Chondromyces crocatus]